MAQLVKAVPERRQGKTGGGLVVVLLGLRGKAFAAFRGQGRCTGHV